MRKPFTKEYIETASNDKGIYYFYEGNEKTYIGSSDHSIRSRLKDHKAGKEGPCTQNAHEFEEQWVANPKAQEQSELQVYKSFYGRLPKCNDRVI